VLFSAFLALPFPFIILLSVGIPILIVIPIVLLVRNSNVKAEDDEAFDGLVALFSFVGTAFALLLAFLIVNAQSDQAAAQKAVFAETSSLEALIKDTNAFAPAQSAEVKRLVLDYTEKMRRYEVDVTPAIGGDPQAAAAFGKILDLFSKLDDENPGDKVQVLLGEVQSLTELRNARVDIPSSRIDGVTTIICSALAALTVAIMALLPAPRRWVRWVQSLGVAIAVGLVMSLVFYIASDSYTRSAEDIQFERIEALM
jgi:hypothetical protein